MPTCRPFAGRPRRPHQVRRPNRSVWPDHGRLDGRTATGASRYGVSIDTPFALGEFAEQNDLNVTLVGDTEREVVDAFGVSMDLVSLGIADVARRAVFVVAEDGTVTYAWVADDPSREPDYDEVEDAAASVT